MLTRSAIIAVALAPLATALAMPLPASAADTTAAVTIRYSQDEIRTAEGAQALALRLRVAAVDVCGGQDVVQRSGSGFRRCVRATLDRSAMDLGSPMVARALSREPGLTTAARR